MNLSQHLPEHNWQHLCQTFSNCSSWEQSYRQLLLLGKRLPSMPETQKIEANEIDGCESRVWLSCTNQTLSIDSEARIIRGLVVILLSLLTDSGEQPLCYQDLRDSLTKLGLAHHLSSSRNSGLAAIWRVLERDGWL